MWDSWVVEGICKKRELPKRDFKNLNTGCISIGNTYQYSSTWDSWVFGVLPKKEIFVTSITKYISIRNIYQYSPMWDSYVLRGSWMHAFSAELTVYNIYIVFRTTVLERIHLSLEFLLTLRSRSFLQSGLFPQSRFVFNPRSEFYPGFLK